MWNRFTFAAMHYDVAFRGGYPTGKNIVCKCGRILIQDYDPDNFCGFDIKCICFETTSIEGLKPGEILSQSIVNMGGNAASAVTETLLVPPTAVVATAADILRESACWPAPGDTQLNISPVGIEALIDKYKRIGGAYDLQLNILGRGSPTAADDFPFAHAAREMRRCHANRKFDLSLPETQRAILNLYLFHRVVCTWGHHPRFKALARSIGDKGEFLHTCYLFLAAEFLFATGIRVGLSIEGDKGKPLPDLYMKGMSSARRFYAEVKVPDRLVWRGEQTVAVEIVHDEIGKKLKQSKKQIKSGFPGVLVIGSNSLARSVNDALMDAAKSAMDRRGHDHPSLAGIITIGITGDWKISPSELRLPYQYEIAPNPQFEGKNPFTLA